ncbi:MAG: ABC transporter ATP-binding protein [Candidatus Nezhaarchaeales archaeon]
MPPMLEVRNLMVFYENAIAINDVSLEVNKGEIVGVLGSNSAGKSTLMYTISGIMLDVKRKEEMRGGERITILGRIKYKGEDITNVKPSQRAKKGIILCPERRRIFPESNVLENLKIGGYLRKRSEVKEALNYVFKLFPELVNLRSREGGFLSGGEQQMLAIGRALMAKPELLLLDEPLLGLAPSIQARVVEAIKKIREERGITILLAEQYARPLLPIVDRAYILENGAIVLTGTGKELAANPHVRAAYLGL